MPNLLRTLFPRGNEISRFSVTDYLRIMGSQFGLVPPSFSSPTTYSRGRPTERIENSFKGYIYGAYKANPIVYGCIKARSSVFSEARFVWRNVEDPDDTFRDESLAVLDRPWMNGSTGELLTRMIQDADLAGNFYAVRDGDRLRRLRPDWVQIILSGNPLTDVDVDVIGYVYTPNGPDGGDGRSYSPEEIVHWSPEPDPDAMYRGTSWLTSVIREIQGDQAATAHKLKFFERGATMGPIVKVPAGPTAAQFKDFIAATEAAHAGLDNAYATMYLGNGADVTLAAADFRQLEFTGSQGKAETRIAMASRVPAVILQASEGLSGSSLNAGNYQAAKKMFVDGEMRPLWRSACAALGTIVPAPDGYELWIDEPGIAYLRDDARDVAMIQQTQAATIGSLIQAGFEPETAVTTVNPSWKNLKHSGLVSVQLLPPGQAEEPGSGEPPPVDTSTEAPAPTDSTLPDDSVPADLGRAELAEDVEDLISRGVDVLAEDEFDFEDDDEDLEDEEDDDEVDETARSSSFEVLHPRGAGGKFRDVFDKLNDWARGAGDDHPLAGTSRPTLLKTAKHFGITPRRGESEASIEKSILDEVRTRVHAAREAANRPNAHAAPSTPSVAPVEKAATKAQVAKREQRIADMASRLHEDWRKTRKQPDGKFEPRVKTTKDEAWIHAHGTDQVDIANTTYANLPADWQKENRDAAAVIDGILQAHGGKVDLSDEKTRLAVGEQIHQEWLKRNEWAKGGELDKPFADLPKSEQDKDIDQLKVAMGTPAAPKKAAAKVKAARAPQESVLGGPMDAVETRLHAKSTPELRKIATGAGIHLPATAKTKPEVIAAMLRQADSDMKLRDRTDAIGRPLHGVFGRSAIESVLDELDRNPTGPGDVSGMAAKLQTGHFPSEGSAAQLINSDSGLNAPKLRQLADQLGIQVPPSVKSKMALQSHIAQHVSKPSAPDRAQLSRDRQAKIDKARGVAEVASRVHEYHASEVSPTVMEHTVQTKATLHGVDQPTADRLKAAGVAGDMAAVDRIAGEHGLTRITGPAGAVEPFSSAKHERIGDVREGQHATVVRPGYEASVGGEKVTVTKGAAMAATPEEIAAHKEGGVPKPAAPHNLSPGELNAIGELAARAQSTQSGWVHSSALPPSGKANLEALAARGILDRNGDFFRVAKPNGEVLPRQETPATRMALHSLNTGAVIHGYSEPGNPSAFGNIPDTGADQSRVRRIAVQRIEPVDEHGNPAHAVVDQTHRIISGHDTVTGQRVKSGPVPVGSYWEHVANPDVAAPSHIEGEIVPQKAAVSGPARVFNNPAPDTKRAPLTDAQRYDHIVSDTSLTVGQKRSRLRAQGLSAAQVNALVPLEKKAAKAAPSSADVLAHLQHIGANSPTATGNDEARRYLDGLGLSSAQLRQLAKDLQVPHISAANKQDIRDAIVKVLVTGKLTTRAVHRF